MHIYYREEDFIIFCQVEVFHYEVREWFQSNSFLFQRIVMKHYYSHDNTTFVTRVTFEWDELLVFSNFHIAYCCGSKYNQM